MRLGDHTPIKELHDIEVGANNTWILTQAVCLWDRYIRVTEGLDDLVFSVHPVGGLGQ